MRMNTKRRATGTCLKNVLVIFIFLIFAILLFIPYRSIHIRYRLDAHSLIKYKTTTYRNGYMFIFKYFNLRSRGISQPESDQDSYFFNTNLFLAEIGMFIFLAILDYFVFCFLLRKRRTGKKLE